MTEFRQQVNVYLKQLKDGDFSDYTEFYHYTYPFVRYTALRYLVDRSHTDDVVNETFARVARSISRFNVSKNGYSWMYKIAQNVAYNYNAKYDRCVSFDEVEGTDRLAYDMGDDLEDRHDLAAAIGALDEADRAIFDAYVVRNMTYEQIGKKLGIATSTVDYRIKKVYKTLQKLLSGDKK